MSRSLLIGALLVLFAGCSPAASTPSAATTGSEGPPIRSVVPSASASPSVSPMAPSRLVGMGRRLDAGRYIYDEAFPNVTFELPADWTLDEAMPRHFGIRPKDMAAEDSFIVWFDMRIASKARSCPELPEQGVGHSARALRFAFQRDPGLVVTQPHGYLLGGLRGDRFDVSLAPTWKRSCPFASGAPTVPLFVDDNVEGEPAFWGVTGKERIRMVILDAQGSNVMITYDSAKGTTLDAIEAAAKPVLDSLHFEVGGLS